MSCKIAQPVAERLWRSCRSKRICSKLLTPGQSVLARCLDFEEEPIRQPESVKRPLAYRFDFIEVFAGAPAVTAIMANRGISQKIT